MNVVFTMTDQGLAEYLNPVRKKIYEDWFEQTAFRFKPRTTKKMAFLYANRKRGADLFSVLLDSLKRQQTPAAGSINAIYNKIRSIDYSIADFYVESICLERCIEGFLLSLDSLTDRQILDAMTLVRFRMDEITILILAECTQVFKHIAVTSKIGFCQTDTDGNIIFANREMERLTEENTLIGKKLIDYFKDESRDAVRAAIRNENSNDSEMVKLRVLSSQGTQSIVGAEIGSVVINGLYKGGYAHITDITKAENQHHRLFDRALLGIVNLNINGDILFANRCMLEMLNMEKYQNKNVFELLPDKKSSLLVKKQLRLRKNLEADEYPLKLVRSKDKALVPVRVSAFPETDLSGEHVVGSYAIVRNTVAEEMHSHIESHHNEKELLQAVTKEMKLIIPFDLVAVSKTSNDGKSACAIFSYNTIKEQVWRRYWWRLTQAQLRWVEEEEPTLVEDLEEFFNQPEWRNFKKEKDIIDIIEQGYKSLIFYPIKRDNRLVAIITLMSKSQNSLKNHHVKLLRDLPVKSAVHMALYYHERRLHAFAPDLILNLTNARSDVKAIAELIVTAVSGYFNLQSVSLFKVNKGNGVIELIDQAAQDDKYLIEKGYFQDIDIGVLGSVARSGQIENHGNVHKENDCKNLYHNLLAEVKMHSELCIPIKFGGALWLLNLEDEQVDAFSKEEEEEFCRVLDEVKNYLENNWLSRFLEASLKASSDAMIVMDENECVIQVNPAADALLMISQKGDVFDDLSKDESPSALRSISPINFRTLFVDPKDADSILLNGVVPVRAIKLKRRHGGQIQALLSMVDLQKDYNRTIFVVTDITAQQRMKEIENLEKVYYELAVQTKTPLSLALAWIDRLEDQLSKTSIVDLIDKTRRQLKKLEISYNRIAMYADEIDSLPYHPTLLSLNEVMDAVKNNLPLSEHSLIDWPFLENDFLLIGDLHQLRFCFETLFSYLLRFVPCARKIDIRAECQNDEVELTISGWLPYPEQLSADNPSLKCLVSQAVADLAFGQRLIRRIISDLHGGTFTYRTQDANKMYFRIILPLWQGGHHG